MKLIAFIAWCSYLIFNLNTTANGQARERFMKEAPASWAEYRQKLSTDIQIKCHDKNVEHHYFVVTKQGQTIYKKGRYKNPFDQIEMFDGSFYFRYSKEGSKWTGIESNRGTAVKDAAWLSKYSKREVFRLLMVGTEYLDDLKIEDPNCIESVDSISIDGKEYFEIVIHISRKRQKCTAILDPRNHWTVKSYLNYEPLYYDPSQTLETIVSFETTKFLGVAVASTEDYHHTTWQGNSGSDGIGKLFIREYTEVDQSFFDQKYAEIRELVPSYSGRRVDNRMYIPLIGLAVFATSLVVIFLLFKKTRTIKVASE